MSEEEIYFNIVGNKVKEACKSQMFGKPCFKVQNKAFACFFNKTMVFKLTEKAHKEALSFDGSKLFDPSGKNRPMKEWVQVPFDYKEKWVFFAKKSSEYVKI